MSYEILIGTPYEEKHCWDIVVAFYKIEFGVELKHAAINPPQQREDIQHLIWSHKGDYRLLTANDPKEFGDIVLMKFRGIESHIGVYVGSGRLLHSMAKVGCVVDLIKRWDNNITGVYRLWNKPKKASTHDSVKSNS